jgi:hypothetical protein
VYDLKVLMQTTLYGLPHLHIEGAGRSAEQMEKADRDMEVALVDARDITLTLSYDLSPGVGGQVVEVSVDSLDDSLGILDALDVDVRQEISFGRPQLSSLSFDVVYDAAMIPRGVTLLSGEMAEHDFDPIITRIITDHVYDATEPGYGFEQWFPTQPVNINRLGSRFGDGGNKGQLVLYPLQFKSDGSGAGVLRVYEQLRLSIFYDDGSGGSDWQAPVIRRVEVVSGVGQAQIFLTVIDPDWGIGKPSGVQDVFLSYSTDGVQWSDAETARNGDVWSATILLPPGRTAANLGFVAQAVDGAGNVAHSSNKGEVYQGEGIKVYLPLLLKSD